MSGHDRLHADSAKKPRGQPQEDRQRKSHNAQGGRGTPRDAERHTVRLLPGRRRTPLMVDFQLHLCPLEMSLQIKQIIISIAYQQCKEVLTKGMLHGDISLMTSASATAEGCSQQEAI